jgi:hypothetical protein
MYRVPEKDILDALNLSPQGKHEKSLKDLNKDYYPDRDGYVMDTVKATILAHQTPQPPDSVPATVSPPTARRTVDFGMSEFLLTQIINFGAINRVILFWCAWFPVGASVVADGGHLASKVF